MRGNGQRRGVYVCRVGDECVYAMLCVVWLFEAVLVRIFYSKKCLDQPHITLPYFLNIRTNTKDQHPKHSPTFFSAVYSGRVAFHHLDTIRVQ